MISSVKPQAQKLHQAYGSASVELKLPEDYCIMKDLQWAKECSDKIKKKLKVVADRNRHKIPYSTDAGVFNDMSGDSICWWTNGFWGGMMWQLFHATGDEMYKEIAIDVEKKLDRNLMTYWGMDHDIHVPTSHMQAHTQGDNI